VTFEAAARQGSWNNGLGFIADHNKNGNWGPTSTSGNYEFSGGYFLPGSPLEGWSLEYETTPGGHENRLINKGRVGRKSLNPTTMAKTSPAWKGVSSGHQLNSASWVGTWAGTVKISKTIQFRTDDLFFTTKITLENVGSSKIYNLDYMRNVDPDQGQPHGCSYTTRNFVKYQPATHSSDPSGRARAAPQQNTALVVAVGQSSCNQMVLGLGTVHPRARVNHFGFQNNDPDTVSKQGVANTAWHGYSESSPRSADAGINLGFNFPELDAGASVTFSFAYVLDEADLDKAMGSINELIMTQPTGTVGGSAVDIACRVESSSSSLSSAVATFNIIRAGSIVRTIIDPDSCTPELAPSTGCTFTVTTDTTSMTSASDYEFKCSVQIGTKTGSNPPKETSAVVAVDNDGPKISVVSPTTVPASFNNDPATPTKVVVTKDAGSADWSEVKFFRENAVVGGVTSTLVHTDSSPGATSEATIDVSDLPDGFPLTVKVVAKKIGQSSQRIRDDIRHRSRAQCCADEYRIVGDDHRREFRCRRDYWRDHRDRPKPRGLTHVYSLGSRFHDHSWRKQPRRKIRSDSRLRGVIFKITHHHHQSNGLGKPRTELFEKLRHYAFGRERASDWHGAEPLKRERKCPRRNCRWHAVSLKP
jgi:hypothetical protein